MTKPKIVTVPSDAVVERIVNLLWLLQDPEGWSVPDLLDVLNCSRATLYRDLKIIEASRWGLIRRQVSTGHKGGGVVVLVKQKEKAPDR